MYVFVHQFMFCFLPCVSYLLLVDFILFIYRLFIYWLFLLCLQNLFFIPSNLLFIYWSIVYFPFIYLFISALILYCLVMYPLIYSFIDRILCVWKYLSRSAYSFLFPFIASYLLFISWSIFRKHAYLLIIPSLFTESFLWPPSDLTDIIFWRTTVSIFLNLSSS